MMAIQYTTTYQQPEKINLNSALSSFAKERELLHFEITFGARQAWTKPIFLIHQLLQSQD